MDDTGTVAAGCHIDSVLDIGCVMDPLACRSAICKPDPSKCHIKGMCTVGAAQMHLHQQFNMICSKQLLIVLAYLYR